VKLLGVYPKAKVGTDGIPFATRTHPNPSAAAVVVVQVVHDRSFLPVDFSHCPLEHWELLVQ
jgi:hypothetical protein